jgi:hypothetical protein
MESIYKNKYLTYKAKYLSLKKKLVGGTRFLSIPNNGGGEPGFTNQCIWLSIRDYLNYSLGIIITATELKRGLRLGPETDIIEYDEENPLLRDALHRLVVEFGLTLCFIITRYDGTIAPYCLNQDGTMKPFRTINPGFTNVYIATFGRHFELIVEGPNYQLPRDPNSTIDIDSVNLYEPKVKIHDNYVLQSEASGYGEQEIIKASVNLVETIQNIEFFENQLKNIQKDIKENEDGLRNIKTLDLDSEQKTIIASGYQQMITTGNITAEKIITQLEQLRRDKATFELIIN